MWRCATISVACRSRLCTCESATAVLCMRVEVSFCRGVGALLMSLRCRGVQWSRIVTGCCGSAPKQPDSGESEGARHPEAVHMN